MFCRQVSRAWLELQFIHGGQCRNSKQLLVRRLPLDPLTFSLDGEFDDFKFPLDLNFIVYTNYKLNNCRFLHPITYGTYPECMQVLAGDRLPKFTKSESELVKGSIDFVAVNYYTSYYAEDVTSYNSSQPSYTTDSRVNLTCTLKILKILHFLISYFH